MTVDKISISLPREVIDEVGMRDNGDGRSGAIATCLERYFAALQITRREIAKVLSSNEISLILDVLNGVMFSDRYGYPMIWSEVEDGIRLDKLDEKWQVIGKKLVEKVRALSYIENMALADAAECWWIRVGKGENPDASDALSWKV